MFFDYDKLLQSEYDTVYIALPNVIHFDFAKEALLADKNVIVEKPATSNPQEFCELRELAKEKHLFLFEAVDIPYLPDA